MPSPASPALDDLAEFRARARTWLGQQVLAAQPGSEREDPARLDVSVFHDLDEENERAHLDTLVDWHHRKLSAGFAALTWSPEWGGAGLTRAHERAFVEEEEQIASPAGHELFSVTTKLVAPTIEELGTPEQKERFVRPFLRADELCCQLFSEPGAGSDLAAVSTRARADDTHWILDGQKIWSSGAHLASWGLALCRTDPNAPKHKGITAFLVPLDLPGVEVRPIRQMSGGTSFSEVFLTDARIPDDLRVGAEGQGWAVALTVLGHERAASGGSGDRGGSFDQLVAVARSRELTDDPHVRQALARVHSIQRTRAWTRARVAATARAGRRTGPEGSIGKLLWTQAMDEVSRTAALLLGPSLVADSGAWGTYEWGAHVLGAPGYRIAGGSDEIQRTIIGERVLGLPPEPRLDRELPFRDLPR